MKNIDRFMAACAALMLVVACGGGSGKGSGSDQEAAPGEPSEAPKSEPTGEPTTTPADPTTTPNYYVSVAGILTLEKGPEEANGKAFMMKNEGAGFVDLFASEESFQAEDFAGHWWDSMDALCGDFLWLRVQWDAPSPEVKYPLTIGNAVIAIGGQGGGPEYRVISNPLGNVTITSFTDEAIEGTFGWSTNPEENDGAFRVPVRPRFEVFPE